MHTNTSACPPPTSDRKSAIPKRKKTLATYPPSREIQILPPQSRSTTEATAVKRTNSPAPSALPLAPGDLVDEAEAAAILGVNRKTVANWRWKGQGPKYSKIGRRLVRYHRADLAAFAAGDAA
jgi:predicted DNA-binding transcriptional regulator AlpA